MTEDNELLTERVAALEASLAALKDEFLTKAQTLKIELVSVRKLIEKNSEQTESQTTTGPAPYVWEQNSGDSLHVQPEQRKITDDVTTDESVGKTSIQQPPQQAPAVSTKDAWDNYDSGSQTPIKKTVVTEVKEPGFLQLFISNLLQSILGYLLNTLTVFKAPFQDLYFKLVELYFHYKKQGKAPVFLMTMAGLITLSFGFAYLLQYSFTTVFNDTLKSLTGFVIGAGIIGAGILLSKKKTDFRDYGASVIALGVIFLYLTAYFIGPYYALVSETTGFILLLGVTALSFVLARLFETRVVAAVTLVGGMFMPFIVGDVESIGLAFLAYLLLLSSSNLYLSRFIKWPALSKLSFVLSLSVIEYIGLSEAIFPLASITLLSAFFYLYTYYWTFDGVTLKESLSKHALTILVANVFYFLYAILQLSAEPIIVAGVLITHAVVLVLLMKGLSLMKSIMAPLYLLYIGLLIATAVFVLSPADVTSIIWAVEGLAMSYIGFRYSHKLIRVEGYAIYVIAMLSLLWQAAEAFIFIDLGGFAWHWINLAAFGLLSFIAYRIIYRYKDVATSIELKSAFIQNEIFSLWGSIALCLVIGLYLPAMMLVLAVVPMLWSFYRVSKHKLRFAQVVGFIFFIPFILQISIGVIETDSILMTQQPVYSWIAMLEILFFSWALHFYYRHFDVSGKGQIFARKIHEVIFYVPLVLTGVGLLNVFLNSATETQPLIFSYPWFDLIIVGVLLAILYWLVTKTEQPKESESRSQHALVLIESFSILASVFLLYSVFIVSGEWMFNAAIIPLLALLYFALKKGLRITEKLAWAHFVLYGIGIFISYQLVGNLHFSEQSWSTRLVMIEILVSAWALLWVYHKAGVESPGSELARYVRIAVYCIIPLLFLPRILRLYPDYLAVGLWTSFTISWLMVKKLKIKLLLKEVTLLFFAATLATVLIALSAVSGVKELPGLIAMITGLLVVSVFHFYESTLSHTSLKQSPFRELQLTSPYFYGFIVAGLSFAFTHQIVISLLLTGLYFLTISLQRKLLVVMRESLQISYGLAWAGLIAAPLLIFSQSLQPLQFVSQILIGIIVNLLSLAGLWVLTHQRFPILHLLQKKYAGQHSQLWFFHGLILLGYIGVLNMIFTPWAVGTSIAMLIHAVFILFLTLNDRFKCLLRLSIALYGLTALKVLLHDMNDFGNLHKVFALMAIGSILMAAAFMFQKIRSRQL